MDTNEAFIVFKPESYKDPKVYREILKRIKAKFKIKAMWPKVPNLEILKTFSLPNEYEKKKFLCAILQSTNKSPTLELVKEVVGRNTNPKKCMLGSIRRDLGGEEALVLYSNTVEEVAEHIAVWRPIFLKVTKDGYGDGYSKDKI